MDEVSTHSTDKTGARRTRPRSTHRTEAIIESHRTRSVHRLTQEDDGVYATSGDFSLEGYSLFKQGDERWARRFGYEIADFLMDAESVGGFRSTRRYNAPGPATVVLNWTWTRSRYAGAPVRRRRHPGR
jgi:hypothetical protein